MFCTHCGTEMAAGSQLCSSCGKPVGLPTSGPARAPAPPAGAPRAIAKAPGRRPLGRPGWQWALVAALVFALAGGAYLAVSSAPTAASPSAKPQAFVFRPSNAPTPTEVTSLPAPSDAGLFANPSQQAHVPGQGFIPDAQRRLDLTSLQVSLAKYRVSKGRYPPTLAELFPAFAPSDEQGHPLTAPPADPQTKQPYGYTVTPDGQSFQLSATLSSGRPYTLTSASLNGPAATASQQSPLASAQATPSPAASSPGASNVSVEPAVSPATSSLATSAVSSTSPTASSASPAPAIQLTVRQLSGTDYQVQAIGFHPNELLTAYLQRVDGQPCIWDGQSCVWQRQADASGVYDHEADFSDITSRGAFRYWLEGSTSGLSNVVVINLSAAPSQPQSAPSSSVAYAQTQPVFVGGISDEQAKKIGGVVIAPLAQQQINRGNVVAGMQQKLPYKGTYFTLAFDNDTWNFVLTLPVAYQQQGKQEFNLFLRANGIDDQSWLEPNLRVVVQ